MREAVARGEATRADLVRGVVEAAGQHALDRVSAKLERKLERRQRKHARREARRLRRLEGGGHDERTRGVLGAVAAFVLLLLAVTTPNWWLVFVAMGVGLPAARALIRSSRDDAAQSDGQMPERGASTGEAPAATLPELERIDARQKRIDEVGAKLLSELKGAPKAVRDFVQRPEETIAALGAASKELARRERELRALLPAAEDARLTEERRALAARVDAETDDIARGRLGAALQALDGQLAQRVELGRAAARFEAEGTRILYTLENLHTQVLRARAADAGSPDVVGAGLRQSLEQIGTELNAIADALEETHQARPQAVVDVAPPLGTEPASLADVKVR